MMLRPRGQIIRPRFRPRSIRPQPRPLPQINGICLIDLIGLIETGLVALKFTAYMALIIQKYF